MKSVLASLLVAGSLALAPSGQAGTHTWTGAGANGYWSTPGNWEANSPPGANESPLHLVFPASAIRRAATNNIGNINLDSVSLDGAAYTLAATGLGTNVTFDSSQSQPYWNIRALTGTGHAFHYSMNVALNGSLEVYVGPSASAVIRSRLSAATVNSGLNKHGAGSLYLDPIEDNTFDGATTIVDGLLRLEGSHSQFGFTVSDVTVPGALIIGGSNLAQQPRCVVWQANQIADNSAVTVNDNGTLELADVGDTIGSLTMAGGVVDTANGTLTLNGNVLVQNPPSGTPSQLLGHLGLGNVGRFFTVETNAYFDVGGVISGGALGNAPAGVYKLGPGWMAFTGPSNTFGGDLYISAGTLSITNRRHIGALSNAVSVASGGILALTGTSVGPVIVNKELNLQGGARLLTLQDSEWNGPINLAGGMAFFDMPDNVTLEVLGGIAGPGGLKKIGEGELRLVGSEGNTFDGGLEADHGEVYLHKCCVIGETALTSRLTVGTAGNGPASYGTVRVLVGNHSQASSDIVVNYTGILDLDWAQQVVSRLTLVGGRVEMSTGKLVLAGSITNRAAAANGVINGRLELHSVLDTHCYVETNSTLTLNAAIEGTTGNDSMFTKYGPGRLQITGWNSYKHQTRIWEGELELIGGANLGLFTVGSFTTVEYKGTLALNNARLTNEPIHIKAWLNDTPVRYRGTNVLQTAIHLYNGTNVFRASPRLFETNAHLTLSGSGFWDLQNCCGGVTFDGPGTVHMAQYNPAWVGNNHSGVTWIKQGTLLLDVPSGVPAIPGRLVVGQDAGPSALARWLADELVEDTADVTVLPTGRMELNSHVEKLDKLEGEGVIWLAGGDLTVGSDNSSFTCDGWIHGVGGALTKAGSGIATLTGNNNYTGLTRVEGGTLIVRGNQPQSAVQILNGSTLGGDGRVGPISDVYGHVSPGAAIGRLQCGNYSSIGPANLLKVALDGTTPGVNCDQLDVAGSVSLIGGTIEVAMNFAGAVSNQYVILKNDGADPVSGSFMNLPEGASLTNNFVRFVITYQGGDGNDVVLIQQSLPPGPKLASLEVLGGWVVYLSGTGMPNTTYIVEATESLSPPIQWTVIGTAKATQYGAIASYDPDAKNHPIRFYRFVLP